MDIPVKSIYPLRICPPLDDKTPRPLCTASELRQAVLQWTPVKQADRGRLKPFRVFHDMTILEHGDLHTVDISAYVAPDMLQALTDSALGWTQEDLRQQLESFLNIRRPLAVRFLICVVISPPLDEET